MCHGAEQLRKKIVKSGDRGEGIIPVVESRGDGGSDETGEGLLRETDRASATGAAESS